MAARYIKCLVVSMDRYSMYSMRLPVSQSTEVPYQIGLQPK